MLWTLRYPSKQTVRRRRARLGERIGHLVRSKGSDPADGFDLKDERTGTREQPFTGFDPVD